VPARPVLAAHVGGIVWSAEGVRVKFSSGTRTVIGGPFGQAKEIVAGYWILQVKSMDEAIEWAKRLPFEAGGEPEAEGEIEVRQMFELEEFGESPAVERGRQLEREPPKKKA
jgi:hypothetical protein